MKRKCWGKHKECIKYICRSNQQVFFLVRFLLKTNTLRYEA
ncbi:MAG: hypothetical protein V6009_01745 [Candidatus Dasytiphilus stammeri]